MAVMQSFLLWIFTMCTTCSMTYTARVLVIPQNINSHMIYLGRAASSLADEGHMVTILASTNVKVPDFVKHGNAEVVYYKATQDVPFANTEECAEMLVNYALAETLSQRFLMFTVLAQKYLKNWEGECQDMLDDSGMRKLVETRDYDIAILDVTGLNCMSVLPFNHNIPVIHLGVLQGVEQIFRVPSLPSMLPNLMLEFSDEMTFSERLLNTLANFGHIIMFGLTYNKNTPSTPPQTAIQMYENGIFFFILDDPVIDYPRPLMPNMAYIGDVVPQPPKTLPDHISAFISSAREGAIVVSFGTYFDSLPEKFATIFCRVFHDIPQKVVWKFNKALCEADPEKVLLLDWLPQNDLLAHDNVKIFISHCGVNSVLESIYHGTPILGLPLAMDQPYNALRVQNKGFGVRLNLRDLTEVELTQAIADLMTDETILSNVKRASAIMKHKQVPPQQRMSHWVEHLVSHGHQHLRTAAFELNMFQFHCLDVLLVIFGGAVLVCVLVYYCIKYTCRCTKYCCCKKTTRKTKME